MVCVLSGSGRAYLEYGLVSCRRACRNESSKQGVHRYTSHCDTKDQDGGMGILGIMRKRGWEVWGRLQVTGATKCVRRAPCHVAVPTPIPTPGHAATFTDMSLQFLELSLSRDIIVLLIIIRYINTGSKEHSTLVGQHAQTQTTQAV